VWGIRQNSLLGTPDFALACIDAWTRHESAAWRAHSARSIRNRFTPAPRS